jgi:hypothetical protein
MSLDRTRDIHGQYTTARPTHNPLLDRLPTNERGHVNNSFLDAVRAGLTEPVEIVGAVRDRFEQIAAKDPKRRDRYERLLDAIDRHFEDALHSARLAMDYLNLPVADRAQRHEHTRRESTFAAMAGRPTTQRQADMLRARGITEVPTDMAEAGRLIDALLNRGGHRAS